jgi:hypothetical protein
VMRVVSEGWLGAEGPTGAIMVEVAERLAQALCVRWSRACGLAVRL